MPKISTTNGCETIKTLEVGTTATKVWDNSGAGETGESFKGLNKGCVVDFASRAL